MDSESRPDGESDQDLDGLHDETIYDGFSLAMSKIATDDMVLLPGFVLDEMFRTAQYCMTAHNLAMFADMGDDYSDIIELRYAGNPEMLKFDMEYGPILIERLGRLSDEVEKAPDTHNFIERYIEDVKRFMLDLKRYADSMDGCQ